MKHYITELDLTKIKNFRIILDIDGTLLPHGKTTPNEEVRSIIEDLGKHNELYICSNNVLPERNGAIAKLAQGLLIQSKILKPDIRVLDGLPATDKQTIVIGDKITTDGFLAKRIGAKFLYVKRFMDRDCDLFTRIVYCYDDIVGYLLSHVYAPIYYNESEKARRSADQSDDR